MAMIDLDGVYRVKVKGRIYIYAWRGKGAPRLLSESGTPAFIAELAAAHESRKLGDTKRMSGLCAAFRASPEWAAMSPKTRSNWSPWIDRIQVEFGELRVKQFNDPNFRKFIKAWRDKFKATPRSADVAREAFSRLLSFGEEEFGLTINLVTKIPRLYQANRSEVIWTDDDLEQLEKTASPEIMHAAKLAAYTGLRQADVLRLSWSHVSPNAIEIKTMKSGERVTALIPMHAKLRALLKEIPQRSTRVLTTQSGLPWKTGFGSSWQKAIQKAGIDKHFHDLRGTAATMLFKADFTIREIAQMMGWSEDQVEAIINRYVKRDEILKDRIRRLDEAEARTVREKLVAKPSSPK